ncbi:MAG: hypothetical protein AABO41_26545 [Acidobacteriota bacterium]
MASSSIYAALFAVALLTEIAYSFNRYKRVGLTLAAVTFVFVFLTSVAGLALDRERILKGRADGLALSFLVFSLSAGGAYGIAHGFLPDSSITLANIETHTARAAYLKTICYFPPLAFFFIVSTFHFVMSMRWEVDLGRQGRLPDLLAGNAGTFLPKGVVYLRPKVLASLLLLAAAFAFVSENVFFAKLVASPYKSLFLLLVYSRLILYFLLGLECLLWYYLALNDLKRDSLRAAAEAEAIA